VNILENPSINFAPVIAGSDGVVANWREESHPKQAAGEDGRFCPPALWRKAATSVANSAKMAQAFR
jgi:hypothetical protein